MAVIAFAFGSFGDIVSTAGIVIQVIGILYDSRDASSSHRDLMHELRSLHRTLLLTNDAVQKHSDTAVASSLVGSVDQEVKECHLTMRSFLDNINKYRKPLSSTGISSLWGKVWWSLWETEEISSLKSALANRTQRLTMLMTALNSMSLNTLGEDVRSGNKVINDIATMIKRKETLRDNPENVIWVVDVDFLSAKLEIDPSNALTWFELGRSYMAGHKYQHSYEAYQQAVYRDNFNPTIWIAVGTLYRHINQPLDSLDAYSRALRLDPYHLDAWYNIGLLHEDTRNYSDAIEAYNRGHELDPTNAAVSRRLIILLSRARSPSESKDRKSSSINGSESSSRIIEADEESQDDTTEDGFEVSDDGTSFKETTMDEVQQDREVEEVMNTNDKTIYTDDGINSHHHFD